MIILTLNICNVSSLEDDWKLVVDSVVAVAEKHFTQNRTVVISFHHYKFLGKIDITSVSNINEVEIINNLIERVHDLNYWPVVVSQPTDVMKKRNPLTWDTTNNDLHNSYLLVTIYYAENVEQTLEDVREQIEKLENYYAWNPRAKFIILLLTQRSDVKQVIKNILGELRHKEIMNVNVMVLLSNDTGESTMHVYTWFPYKLPSGLCGKLSDIVILDSWPISQRIGDANLFPNKLPNDLGGCLLRVTTFEFPPFVICDSKLGKYKNTSIVDGFEISMIWCLAKAVNATLMLKIPPGDERGGVCLENGTWTGLRADIVYEEADIAMASLLNKLEDHLLFDDSREYFSDRFTWFVARAKPYPRWLGMVRVFAPSTWLVGFLLLIFGGILMRFMASFKIVQKDEGSPKYWNIVICITSVWAVFLGDGIPSMPRNDSFRVFFSAIVFYSYAINTIFQTFFTSYVVDPGLLYQISNLDDLVSYDLVYTAYFPVLDKIFTKEFLKKLRPRKICEPFTCLDWIATEDNYATFNGRALLEYIRDELMSKEGRHEIFAFPEDSFQLNSVMLLPKGSHLLDRINQMLTHIVEAGLPTQWLKMILDKRGIEAGVLAFKDWSDEYVTLTTNHMQGAFYFLFIGFALAITTFVYELFKNLKEKSAKMKLNNGKKVNK
ncbi:hypothetical protein L9F63_010863 [Diploptera punctata]|uniref:Ionotropic glutamate receptor L-glutamate and glycine-binding domain-containing protein n=1 Tax=Diploptera punctata TaxID=6984 RepID=A0AAD8EQW4_DIPPU|nr:hypothetical protein L9F63_010863 [Diploptera punctata]